MKTWSSVDKTTPSQALRDAKLASNPTCTKCGVTKTVGEFPSGVVDYWCTDCRRDYAKQLYRKKRDAMSPAELQEHRAEVNRRQNKRRADWLASLSPSELAEYRERINRENTERRNAAKEAAYNAYGGYKCACCGETEIAFLSIDHVHNDGAEHKRQNNIRTGEQMYRWLARNKFPPGFQVLCMNCQWGKRNNNGVCPHQSEKV